MMMAPVSDFYEQIDHESVTVLVCHFSVGSSSEKIRLLFHDDGTSEEFLRTNWSWIRDSPSLSL